MTRLQKMSTKIMRGGGNFNPLREAAKKVSGEIFILSKSVSGYFKTKKKGSYGH